jgi:hypothetical protein
MLICNNKGKYLFLSVLQFGSRLGEVNILGFDPSCPQISISHALWRKPMLAGVSSHSPAPVTKTIPFREAKEGIRDTRRGWTTTESQFSPESLRLRDLRRAGWGGAESIVGRQRSSTTCSTSGGCISSYIMKSDRRIRRSVSISLCPHLAQAAFLRLRSSNVTLFRVACLLPASFHGIIVGAQFLRAYRDIMWLQAFHLITRLILRGTNRKGHTIFDNAWYSIWRTKVASDRMDSQFTGRMEDQIGFNSLYLIGVNSARASKALRICL